MPSTVPWDDEKLLVETVEDYAIFLLDLEGRVATWNRGAEKIKGYAADEIIGRHFSTFYEQADVEAGKPQQELAIARECGRVEDEGYRLRKDGTRFWANVVITALRDEAGNLRGFGKVTRDLSDRRRGEELARELIREQTAREAAQRSERMLRDSEGRFRALSQRLEVIFEGVADGITVEDRSGRLLLANSTAAALHGCASVDAFLHSPAESFERFELNDEQGNSLERQDLPGGRALRGESGASAVVRVFNRQLEREHWCKVRAGIMLGHDGEPELAVSIWHDITASRQRERQERCLSQMSAALSQTLDSRKMGALLAEALVPELCDSASLQLLDGEGEPDPAIARVVRSQRAEIHARSIVVPLVARGRTFGVLSLTASKPGRRYGPDELELVEEIGRRAGAALENAELFAAEKRARERLSLLVRAGEAFSAAADYDETLHSVVGVALPSLADFAFLDVVENGQVRRVALAHDDSEAEALLRDTAWVRWEREDVNLCALSSGEAACHPELEESWLTVAASESSHVEVLRRLGLCSMITVPLRARGELLGALNLCYGKSQRRHVLDDQSLAEELACRASMAVTQARLHHESRQAVERAEEASRIKDEFLATVSHELRTPLNAIVGWATLLRGRLSDPTLEKGISVICRNAQAQVKIIDDILDVSRIVTGKLRLEPRPADLVAIVRDGIEVVRPSAVGRNLTIEFNPPSEACLLSADPERLQQVVWNLLSNAVKFTDAGGRIRVEIRRDGSQLSVAVIDSGRGIAPAFLPFVFDRFKQADGSTTRRVGGLGLGLALVRHIVELHGGQVHADSAGVGLGSKFKVTLPVRAVVSPCGEDDEPSVAPPPPRTVSMEGLRVLVVDDEADARDLLSEVLSEAGAEIRTAGSAAEGFRLLEKFNPHVLVSDISMPNEDGYSFMRRVRGLDPAGSGGVPSIALTAHTRSEDKTKALSSGFTTHIGKPVSPDALLAAVGNLAQFSRAERWRT